MINLEKEFLDQERENALDNIEAILEIPMNILALVWLGLTLMELTRGLSAFLNNVSTGIWIIFWVEFLFRFFLASSKKRFFKRNIITLISLLVPAARIFRAARFLRFLRGTRFVKILGTFNRSMSALNKSFHRRGFGYAVGLSFIVVLLGAAGIYQFENDYLDSFGTALWWSAMMITTMGSEFHPKSSEGRMLAFFLSIYGLGVFSYVTASIASFFVDRDAASPDSEIAGGMQVGDLKLQIDELKLIVLDLKKDLKDKDLQN